MKLLLEFIRIIFVLLAAGTVYIYYTLYESGWYISASGFQITSAIIITIITWRYGLWPLYKKLAEIIKTEIEKETKK